MKIKLVPFLITIAALLFVSTSGLAAPGASTLGTAFTYQGRLDRAGQPFTGPCDFIFDLFDAQAGGEAIASDPHEDLMVTNSLFTAALDFGAGVFNGDERWLEISVQCPGDSSPTTFARQQLTATPYALYAATAPWSGITSMPSGFMDGVDDETSASGACSPGSTIQAINPDGSFVCRSDAPFNRNSLPTGNSVTTIDSTGDVGTFNAITMKTDGLGLIAYYDATNDALKVSACQDVDCSTSTITVLDNGGKHASIAIGIDGLALISYVSGDHVKVAHCNNSDCTSATLSTIGTTPSPADERNSFVVIGPEGLAYIAANGLGIALCSNIACTSHTLLYTYDINDIRGEIVLGPDSRVHVLAFFEDYGLFMLSCSGMECNFQDVDLEEPFDQWNYLLVGPDAFYWMFNRCEGKYPCGFGLNFLVTDHKNSSEQVDLGVLNKYTGGVTDVAATASSQGSVWITYTLADISYSYILDSTYLALSLCHGGRCRTNIILHDFEDDFGAMGAVDSDITITAEGYPLISYYDWDSKDLVVIHCGSQFCTPYFRWN